MKYKRHMTRSGMTLLELVIASVILGIVSVGALSYQFHARRMAMRAQAEITAARTARLVLDNWKRTGGDAQFDPAGLQMGFVRIPNTTSYTVTVDNLPFTVSLNWRDIETDSLAMVTLREIETVIRWRSDYQRDILRDSDPTYIVSTYVRKEEAGG